MLPLWIRNQESGMILSLNTNFEILSVSRIVAYLELRATDCIFTLKKFIIQIYTWKCFKFYYKTILKLFYSSISFKSVP